MEKKINNAISYFLKYRHYGDSKAVMNDAANYFADSYEEYLTLWDHLDNFYKEMHNEQH